MYPPIVPFDHGFLTVDEIHRIYWEQSGNPKGIPVIVLHGGPGSGTNPTQRRYFDPKHYRIILFDQRGCGKSLPYAETRNNTTWFLVNDIEKLRQYLEIDKWFIFGGSWGVSLALAYGEMYPKNCLGFILRGVFLGRRRELNWFLEGIQTIFPEAYKEFREFLPRDERDQLLFNFHRRLMDPNKKIHTSAAQAWNRYETNCSILIPQSSKDFNYSSVALAKIEAHYFVNEMFLMEKPLLENLTSITELPAIIIHGRYDIICPIISAFELTTLWPNSFLKVIPNAGHSAMEPGIRSALVQATDKMLEF